MPEEPPETLDDLCGRALSGDDEAQTRLYQSLRVRFFQVAKRRVRSDDVEDVLQEGLRIVHLKLRSRRHTDGVLPWSMAILRNVVGNYYRKRSVEARRIEFPAESRDASDLDEARERAEEMDRLSRALDVLSRSHPRCGALYREILRSLDEVGDLPGRSRGAMEMVLQRFPNMTPGTIYVALHRCRSRLRRILAQLEEGTDR